MMIIGHISDNHSVFLPIPPEAEVIVHTGDFLPNLTRGDRSVEVPYQTDWLHSNRQEIIDWIGPRPFIFCSGNHDFCPNVCEILRDFGILAIDVTCRRETFRGIRFVGFPFIPYLVGEWNGECTPAQMAREMRWLKDQIQEGCDVLMTHAPPYGILDNNFVGRDESGACVELWGEHCGNRQLANYLSYELPDVPDDKRPRYLCCGHIHQHNGLVQEFDLLISNAATTVNLIEVRERDKL